ncbi:MAG: sugar ABC transporter permease [Alphaproteobacteria bacterium]
MSDITPGRQDAGLVGSIARFNWRAYGMIIALLVIAVTFDILTDGIFLSSRNLSQLMRQSAVLIVVASGVAVLIIQGEIDLSIGSAVYLTGLAAAVAQTQWGFGTVEALTFALVVGLAIGCWQGFWVAWVGIPSFVVTLAGLLGLRGVGYVWSNAATYAPMNSSHVAISESFISHEWSVVAVVAVVAVSIAVTAWRWSAKRRRFGPEAMPASRLVKPIVVALIGAAVILYAALGFRGIPMAVVVALAVAAALSFVTLSTIFGRQLYAIGGNREAAFLSGIDIRRNLFFSFVIMGAIYAVAGVLTTARLNAIAPAVGQFLELEAIAAAVIGGISLGGGIGTVYGAIVGALLLVVVDNGMSLMNVSSFVQLVVKALLLGFAVWFDLATRPGGRLRR